ncbi:MAG: YHS domain-containing protein [Porticoccaceae bacterium]|jgi:YHS domain-containing protein
MLSYSDAFFKIRVWPKYRFNRAMTMQMKTVFRVGILATTATAGMFVALQAQEKTTEPKPAAPEKSTKESRAAVQEALAPFNSLIGGWRGSGQVRRGSTRGAWRETGTFVWKFGGGKVGVEYQVKDGKHIGTGLLSWDSAKKEFTMDAVFDDGSKRAYRGKLEKKVLTLISEPDNDEIVSRVTLRQLNEKRMLVLYEKRRSNQSFYARVGEVGYTREGTRLASSGSSGPECVVTGGAGTIKVSYAGKTYYVCCTGCRDAFNDDPVGILADYRAKLAEKKSKSN